MIRAQCLVIRGRQILMVKHRHRGNEWWCLPGGGVEPHETADVAALRELKEECCVVGKILCKTSAYMDDIGVETVTYLVEIGDQEPCLGTDPEFPIENQIMVDMKCLTLSEIAERDRVYLWAAGLLSIPVFLDQVSSWGDVLSYPTQ